jgi:hypothetical protein
MKTVRPVISHKPGPLLLNEVGGIAQYVRKGGGRKEEKDGIILSYSLSMDPWALS